MKLYLDYRQYTTELYDYGKSIVAYYYWIFPNMMFNFYPWGLSINIVKPILIDKKSYFFSYIFSESRTRYASLPQTFG